MIEKICKDWVTLQELWKPPKRFFNFSLEGIRLRKLLAHSILLNLPILMCKCKKLFSTKKSISFLEVIHNRYRKHSVFLLKQSMENVLNVKL